MDDLRIIESRKAGVLPCGVVFGIKAIFLCRGIFALAGFSVCPLPVAA